MNIRDKTSFFQTMLYQLESIYSTSFSKDRTLLSTNIPEGTCYNTLFLNSAGANQVFSFKENTPQEMPIFISMAIGISWGAVFEQSTHSTIIHILGPVTTSIAAVDNLALGIECWMPSLRTLERRTALLNDLQAIPLVNENVFLHSILGLHYCLNSEKLKISDITSQTIGLTEKTPLASDWSTVYRFEQALMQPIINGNPEMIDKTFNQADKLNIHRPTYSKSTLDDAKVSSVVFSSLCARASIQGGVSPEIAYTLGNHYISQSLSCRNTSELRSCDHSMYRHFITKVKEQKKKSSFSPEIEFICEYIRIHPEDNLDLKELSSKTSYSAYYFSRKFKSETGLSINSYIRNVRMNEACFRLKNSTDSIDLIAEKLRFCSRTFFSTHFKELYGMSPAEYRKKYFRL